MDCHLWKIIKKIEALRRNLEHLINDKKSFTHPDILHISKKLDAALNEYHHRKTIK